MAIKLASTDLDTWPSTFDNLLRALLGDVLTEGALPGNFEWMDENNNIHTAMDVSLVRVEGDALVIQQDNLSSEQSFSLDFITSVTIY